MVLPDGSRGNVVELRVHGVSGTPPEELLDRQIVRQVAGDSTAGFYRPRLREEWRDRASNDAGSDSEPYSTANESIPPPLLEGYSWGGLTSGSPSRALWLILLPFTLINVAPRMRPVPGASPDDSARSAWWVWFLSRVMAVSLTVTITLGATGVGLAVLAWQCFEVCDDLPWPLSAMFYEAPAQWRVLWGTALPLAMLSLLALLSWRKSVQYDLIRPPGMREQEGVDGGRHVKAADRPRNEGGRRSSGVDGPSTDGLEQGSAAEPRLGDPNFWYGRYPVSRLRHVHLQAGVAVVAFSLIIAAPTSPLRWIGIGITAVIGALILAALAWEGLLRRTDIPGADFATPSMRAKAGNLGWILLIWVPVALSLVVGLTLPHGALVRMAGYDVMVTVWFAGQSALTLVMFVLIAVMSHRDRNRTPRRAMRGMGTVVLTILALYLGAALTSGFVILSSAWITSSTPWITIEDVDDLLTPTSPIKIPTSLQYAGLGTFAVAVVVVIVMVLTALYVGSMWIAGGARSDRRHAAEAADRARKEQPDRFDDHRKVTIERRRKMIARSIWIARRVDYLPGYMAALVLTIGVVGSLMTLIFGYRRLRGESLGWFGDLSFWAVLGMGSLNPVAVGVWLIGVLLVGLVVLGALAFRVPKTRKAVGILWDIGSFWPRDVHPLAPPCYAERAVPELAMRLDKHAEMVAGSGLVVLASHSQGTVLSMAALLGPGRSAADRTVLLTFGTVLRRLYARFFPLYFSPGAFAEVARRLGEPDSPPGSGGPWDELQAGLVSPDLRWRNFWRRTDYLGGRLGDPLAEAAVPPTAVGHQVSIDVEFDDPVFLPGVGDTAMPTPGRHSNFPRDPRFQAELMRLIRGSFASLDPAMPGESWAIAVETVAPEPADNLMNPRESMA